MDNACSVSIIVPIYNVEKYLYESLQSLKKQTFPVFEVIMIDDWFQLMNHRKLHLK